MRDLAHKIDALRDEFHSPIDFGNGLVAKPWHVQRRFRRRLRLLQIPEDLTGKTVLDIGAWDGYFSFEFERRGAKRVLAIDKYAWENKGLDCFLLAREHFKSRVEYQKLDVHDLSPENVGVFDLVFCAGVLYHLRHPLLGLERIRSVTASQLILGTASLIPAVHERIPMITFFPGDADAAKLPWHQGGFPTRAWVMHALAIVGFSRRQLIYSPSMRYLKKSLSLLSNAPRHGRLIVHAFVR